MKAQSQLIERRHIEREPYGDSSHLAGPYAALCVALGGAAVVVGGMLLVGVPELNVAHLVPDFAALQSLIIG